MFCMFSCRPQGSDLLSNNLRGGVPTDLALPCGGHGVVNSTSVLLSSVYMAAGPVLYNLTVAASHTTVYSGQVVELVATAHSSASLTTPLGKLS